MSDSSTINEFYNTKSSTTSSKASTIIEVDLDDLNSKGLKNKASTIVEVNLNDLKTGTGISKIKKSYRENQLKKFLKRGLSCLFKFFSFFGRIILFVLILGALGSPWYLFYYSYNCYQEDNAQNKFYKENCKELYSFNCTQPNFLPKEVGNGFFDHETGEINNDLMKIYVSRRDCSVNQIVDNSYKERCKKAKLHRNCCAGMIVSPILFLAVLSWILE